MLGVYGQYKINFLSVRGPSLDSPRDERVNE